MRTLVARNVRVYFETPAIDATRHTETIFQAFFTKPGNHLQAPHAVMAVDDERARIGSAFESLQIRGYCVHGDQRRFFDARKVPLFGLANIDKRDLFPRFLKLLDLLRSDFERTGGRHTAPV